MPRSKAALTPAMAQYARMKDQHKDAILFFRMGDFYETFGDDARLVSRVLGITLTARNSGSGGGDKTPLAGVPYHAVEKYIAELVGSGYKVAVCEQVEDPKKARGVVKRDVVEVVTPGTSMLAQTLDPGENNYMVALTFDQDVYGLAFLDLSTGEFRAAELDEDDLLSELNRLAPTEAIVSYDRAEQAEALLEPHFPDIGDQPPGGMGLFLRPRAPDAARSFRGVDAQGLRVRRNDRRRRRGGRHAGLPAGNPEEPSGPSEDDGPDTTCRTRC